MIVSLLMGAAIGVILALTGAGGGILAVPMLIFGAGLGVAQAAPIGLLAVGLAAALGALLGLREGTVRYNAALLMAGSGILFSPAGLWLALHTPNRPLMIVFAGVLVVVAVRAIRKAYSAAPAIATPTASSAASRARPCLTDGANGRLVWTTPCAMLLLAIGAVAGLLSGLLGVGGGFVLIPALQRYTDLSIEAILTTSLAVIALVSVAGVLAGSAGGQLNWVIGVPFSFGAISGMVGGRWLARHIASAPLQTGFAAVALLAALALLLKAVW